MLKYFLSLAVLAALIFASTSALDNGLARTPPMGFLSWERFMCTINCKDYPDDCISEKLYRDMAKRMVKDGFHKVGYTYVNIDDCWMEKKRDNVTGRLVADRERFPNGIKALADYVHSLGLKLGIYSDVGNQTCAGYPGSADHFELDAETFAEWGVDMLKLDGCYAETAKYNETYPAMGRALNKTGRPILYSCSWPAYLDEKDKDYAPIAEFCNIWRNFDDISDSFESLKSIIDYFRKYNKKMVPYAGPGHFHDPDMLLIGDFGLSVTQAKTQMALWAILAAPLFMSTDLRKLDHVSKSILLNKDAIAINQDPLGMMGEFVEKENQYELWMRPIQPVISGHYSYAIAILNYYDMGGPIKFELDLEKLGLDNPGGYSVKVVFGVRAQEGLVLKSPSPGNVTVLVPPSGGVALIRATAL